jgi:UDP:flavonoid glycosyltransferase YjiC (YdhE family)
VAYMGSGTISPHTLIDVLTEAFLETDYHVYIASRSMEPFTNKNIAGADEFDFKTLMPNAAAFINHGGQNSIMTGLVNGTPQLIVPGKVFERRNAESVVRLKAGQALEPSNFTAQHVREMVKELETDPVIGIML